MYKIDTIEQIDVFDDTILRNDCIHFGYLLMALASFGMFSFNPYLLEKYLDIVLTSPKLSSLVPFTESIGIDFLIDYAINTGLILPLDENNYLITVSKNEAKAYLEANLEKEDICLYEAVVHNLLCNYNNKKVLKK